MIKRYFSYFIIAVFALVSFSSCEKEVAVTDIMLDHATVALTIGESMTLTATVHPLDATDKSVIWGSSNYKIADVNDRGDVTARGPGTATITVITKDGRYKATCAVIVNARPLTPKITMKFKMSYIERAWSLVLAGSGIININWGDGSAIEPYTLTPAWSYYSPNSSGVKDVTISGENITHLRGSLLQLSTIDVSKAVELRHLDFQNDFLRSFDLSKNINLTYLNCSNTSLQNLDVNNNTLLTVLICYDNWLTSLDVSKLTELRELCTCNNFELNNLDLSKNIKLERLCIGHRTKVSNGFSNLDLSNNTALTSLSCTNNLLASLDVSNNTALTYLYCDNNELTSLDVSNNTLLSFLDIQNNQFTCDELNALFKTLHENGGTIYIDKNPGTDSCDKSIATERGWMVLP